MEILLAVVAFVLPVFILLNWIWNWSFPDFVYDNIVIEFLAYTLSASLFVASSSYAIYEYTIPIVLKYL